MLASLVLGVLTAIQSGQVAANGSTPWLGMGERITVYTPMPWVAVLALTLPRVASPAHTGGRPPWR